MPLNKDFEELFRCLNSVQAKFMVVGAYAVIHYTQPRYTKDIDIWVDPHPENAKKIYQALKKFGAPLGKLTLEDLVNPDMVYQIGIEPNRIDILMGIGKLSFQQAWKNKVVTHYGSEKIVLPHLKDLMKAKKEAGRPHDLMDFNLLRKASSFQKRKNKKNKYS